MKIFVCLLGILISANIVSGQDKRLVVLGSSTAFGTGASVPDSSWVALLHQHYKEAGILDSTFNLAIGGTNPYIAMPDNYVAPPGRPNRITTANITQAIDTMANVIIVSFVSNDFNAAPTALTDEEIKTTLTTIKDEANAEGIVCFITTTQPRTGFGTASRQRLEDLKDSIVKWFGIYAINVFDPLVNPADNTIRSQYRFSGDDIHLNNAGHRVIFEEVLARNIFQVVLPVKLLDFSVSRKNTDVMISWKASGEEADAKYILQRSNNGVAFTNVATIAAKRTQPVSNYLYSDHKPGTSILYYRLQIVENDIVKYSPVVMIRPDGEIALRIFPNPVKDVLRIEYLSENASESGIDVIDQSGRVIKRQAIKIRQGNNLLSLAVPELWPGNYTLRLRINGQESLIRAFVKH